MPYITEERRNRLLDGELPQGAGELNFFLTGLVLSYLGDDANYTKFNEVVGVLECVKQELYRRRITPYEDRMKEQNGDVF